MPAFTRPPEHGASPVIISESATHVVIAFEIPRAALAWHRRFLEALIAAALETPGGS